MPEQGKSVREREREAARYREAAELTLEQLQWLVTYLHRINKPKLAAGLENNRAHIQADLDAIASGRG